MGQQAEEQFLEDCRHLLYHAESNLELANTMEEYCGYTPAKIEYAKGLVNLTQASIRHHHKAVRKSQSLRVNLIGTINQVCRTYSIHRRKARVLFRGNEIVLMTLGLASKVPTKTKSKIRYIHEFYFMIKQDQSIQKTMKQMNISYMDVFMMLTMVDEIDEKRLTYIDSLNEVNQSLTEKRQALDALRTWSSKYIESGREILEPYPSLKQLIEI